MKEIELEITKEDVLKTQFEAKNTPFLSTCCPTYQALRRILNVDTFGVGIGWVWGPVFGSIAYKIGEFPLNSPLEIEVRNCNSENNYSFRPGKYKLLIEEKYLK